MPTPGVRHNGTGSASPPMMEDMAGVFRYGRVWLANGGLRIFRQHIATDSYVTYDLQGAEYEAMGLPNRGYGAFPFDDHYDVAVAVDKWNRVHLAGNGHTDPQRYIVSAPSDITKWTVPPYQFAISGANAHTYNIFNRLSTGELLWFFDQQDTDTTAGRDWLFYFLPTGPDLTLTWKKGIDNSMGTGVGELVRTTAADARAFGSANRSYIMGVFVDERDHIHVAAIFRTGDKDGNTQQQPCYMRGTAIGLNSGNKWRNIAGQAVTTPLTWETRAQALITSAPPISRTYGASICIDPSGKPNVILQNGGTLQGPDALVPDAGPAGEPMGHIEGRSKYVRCFHDGTGWQIADLPTAAIGAARGPTIHRVGKEVCVLTSTGGRQRITRGAGTGQQAYFGPPVVTGIESPPDPITLQKRGQIAILTPDGDNPAVSVYCPNCGLT